MARNLSSLVHDNELDLSMSELKKIPVREIMTLSKVTSLDLSNNALKLLPDDFSLLKRIYRLDLSKNHLTTLPSSFGELSNLQLLDLRANQLTDLPPSFGQLQRLHWLDLKDNPLNPQLAEVAGPCLDEKQCQTCATNVVKYLTDVDMGLKEQMQKRLQKQKNQEIRARLKEQKEKARLKEQNKLERQKLFEERKKQELLRKKEKNSDEEDNVDSAHENVPDTRKKDASFCSISKTGIIFVIFVIIALLSGFGFVFCQTHQHALCLTARELFFKYFPY